MKSHWKYDDWLVYLKKNNIDEPTWEAFMRLCMDAMTGLYMTIDEINRNELVLACGDATEHFQHLWPQEVINEAIQVCVTQWTKGMLETIIKKRAVKEGMLEDAQGAWLDELLNSNHKRIS